MKLFLICCSLLFPSASAISQIQDAALELKAGDKMRYGISIPDAARKKQPVPLVIALHYGWSGPRPAAYYGKEFMTLLIEPGLRELGAILAAPDCPGQNWTNPKSEEAVLELIAHLQARYPVDRARIVVTGFSLGGFGTWYMAALHPEVFSAAIPIAGRPRPEWIEKMDQLPVFVIHSRKDEVVPIGPTAQGVVALRDKGGIVEYVEVNGLGHYETPRYVQYLRKAVPWLRRVWDRRQVAACREPDLQMQHFVGVCPTESFWTGFRALTLDSTDSPRVLWASPGKFEDSLGGLDLPMRPTWFLSRNSILEQPGLGHGLRPGRGQFCPR